MRCPYCSNEIPDDSLFCPECGQRQEISVSEPGSEVKSEDKPQSDRQSVPEFPRNEERWEETREMRPPMNAAPVQKKKSKAPVIIASVVGGLVLIAVVVTAVFLFLRREDSKPDEAVVNQEETEEELLSDVDYNLSDEDELYVEGFVKKTESGDYVLRMEDDYTFYGENFDGEKILFEDARSIYIDESALSEGMLGSIKSNEIVEINGQCYFDDEKLYITPFRIWDEYGENLIEAFEEEKAEKEKKEAQNAEDANRDYILPQSKTRLLTESDVEGLDLREINYAKNEIYARHGRLFQSAELQNYFNSKSWYRGTISPEIFSNDLLSDIERKNADFLSQIEFGIDPNGYKLDAN